MARNKLRAEINQVETRRTIQRINQSGSWFFEKINKINKPLARLTRGHRDSILINQIRNEKGDVTTDPEEIQNTIQTLLQKAILSKTGKPGRNGQISRQIPGTKVKSGSS